MSVAPVMNPSEAAGENSDRNKRMDVKNKDQMVYMTDAMEDKMRRITIADVMADANKLIES